MSVQAEILFASMDGLLNDINITCRRCNKKVVSVIVMTVTYCDGEL